MAKYFISGAAGAGKSTVIAELKQRGYVAYDLEQVPGAVRMEDKAGNPVPTPEHPIDWSKYASNWQHDTIMKLITGSGTIFVGGLANNQQEFYGNFDKIFVLRVTPDVQKHRLLTRTNKSFGKHPKELADSLEYGVLRDKNLMNQPQAIVIDATQPLNKVVDNILEYAND